MACGKKLDGPEMPYDGLCSGPDDPGNSTECDEHEFKSCMTGVISKRSSIFNNVLHFLSFCLTPHPPNPILCLFYDVGF